VNLLLGFAGFGVWITALIVHLSAAQQKHRDVAAFIVYGMMYAALIVPIVYLLVR